MEHQKNGVICLNHLLRIYMNPRFANFSTKWNYRKMGGITTTVKDIEICLDEETLRIIRGVHVKGIRIIEGCKPYREFTKLATKRGEIKRAGLPKKLLKGEY
ncbi:hypothetical protein H5410_055768 [Solanum commersonii]|uniref:Uncharacterized protein n=1 Tax=Solanum commersonii TaxID=4109 RepID=A0A9J5WJA7_SOLCO|nr:hypothetical protein H5410_055768 [Solanum commersonii]